MYIALSLHYISGKRVRKQDQNVSYLKLLAMLNKSL